MTAQVLCGADVIDFLKTTPTIRPQVRLKARDLVDRYREEKDPHQYHQAAWDTVRRPYLTASPYGLALRQAETACRLAPGEDKYTITLGVALYRVGRYKEALAPLTKKAAQAPKKAPAKMAEVVREGTKTSRIIELMKRPGGVTSKELMNATGWQPHSVRGFLSGTLRKKMGLNVFSTKGENGDRSYSIES